MRLIASIAIGILDIDIITAPILLIPRIGATSTLSAMVIGQLSLAMIIDQFGFLGAQKIPIDLTKIIGVLLLIFTTFLITKKWTCINNWPFL